MLIYCKGDLLASDCDIIAHCANCFHTFGAGIAKSIKHVFPEAYAADLATEYAGKDKLGSFSKAISGQKIIYNLYGQYGFGRDRNGKHPLNYKALYSSLVLMNSDINWSERPKVGFPRIGAGLAGGNWDTIADIINSVFCKNDVYIYVF